MVKCIYFHMDGRNGDGRVPRLTQWQLHTPMGAKRKKECEEMNSGGNKKSGIKGEREGRWMQS